MGLLRTAGLSEDDTLRFLLEHVGWVNSVDFSPDGTMLASGAMGGTTKLWDVNSGEQISTITAAGATAVAFSPCGRTFALGSRTVTLWDVETWQEIWHLELDPMAFASTVVFSPDGARLAAGEFSSRGMVRLWDASTGEELAPLSGPILYINSVAFSPDGTLSPLVQVTLPCCYGMWRWCSGSGDLRAGLLA